MSVLSDTVVVGSVSVVGVVLAIVYFELVTIVISGLVLVVEVAGMEVVDSPDWVSSNVL